MMNEYTTLFTQKLVATQTGRLAPLSHLTAAFEAITLPEMNSHALLDRVDSKYLLGMHQAFDILAQLPAHYRALSINGQHLNHYRTLYFDTPGFDLYHLHVNRQAERYKVRCREYIDTCQSYLEVKHRTRKDRTVKQRISTDQPLTWLNDKAEHWLQGQLPVDAAQLEPKLHNTFVRVTLVSRQACERVTLDFDLSFQRGRHVLNMGDLVVAEVKMDKAHASSPFVDQLQAHRIKPGGFSKYCIGVSLLYDHVKKNTLKPQLLSLQKFAVGAM